MAYQCMIQDIAYEYDRHRLRLLGEALSDADKASLYQHHGEKRRKRHSMQRH